MRFGMRARRIWKRSTLRQSVRKRGRLSRQFSLYAAMVPGSKLQTRWRRRGDMSIAYSIGYAAASLERIRDRPYSWNNCMYLHCARAHTTKRMSCLVYRQQTQRSNERFNERERKRKRDKQRGNIRTIEG